MDKPLVSIIIPLFNKLDWIPQTINSVVNQTYKNWECIIIDDGSTDGSFELVTSLTEKYSGNWRIIRQSNSGQSVARNRGIEISSGNYVALLDADDIWFADKLSRQVEFLNANKEVVIRNPNAVRPWQHVIEPLFGYLELGLKLK